MAPKPTLLSKYEAGILSWSKEWMMSEKLDGWRVMYEVESETFYSRSGNVLLLPGRFYEAAKAFAKAGCVTMLDGELWCGRRTGSSAVPSGMVHDDPMMRFMVFDAWTAPTALTALDRYHQFENAGNDVVMPVEQVVVEGNAQAPIDAFFEKVVKEGGEGIVLKPTKMSVHTDGCRMANYLKRKPFETEEFEVVGHHNTDKGVAKGEGYVSSLVLLTKTNNVSGKTNNVSGKTNNVSDKTFKVSYKNFNAPAVGEMVTVRYSDTTVTGLPKFPVYVGKRSKEDMSNMSNMSKGCEEPSTPSLVMPALAKLKIASPEALPEPKAQKPQNSKTQVEANAKTQVEWEANGGYELANGESVFVISSSNSSIHYKVSKAATGSSVYCSCPAWKFQKLNPAVRTCKHCIAVCGAKAERLRCAKATMCLQQMNDLMGKTYKI